MQIGSWRGAEVAVKCYRDFSEAAKANQGKGFCPNCGWIGDLCKCKLGSSSKPHEALTARPGAPQPH
jgi:hypothetical protein